MTDIVDRLNDSLSAGYSELRKEAVAEITRLRAKVEAMERKEPFDAEGDVFRSAFEAALKAGNWPATRQGDGYRSPSTQIAWRIAFSTVNRLKLYLAPGAQPAPIAQDTSVRKAWARFSNELHRSPDAPYPGMADAFERHFSQSFNDREWRSESGTWAAAWKAAKRHEVQAQPAPSMPECPYPCGWRNLLKLAIEDGAYLARSINEDEPVTENARAVTMRMVLRLRDVLMALNNAAPEDNP